jgi:hypothetical protein
MRTIGVLVATTAAACLVTTHSYAQSAEQRPAEEQFEPYHKHHDARLGHDHYYPDRGSIVREVPQGAAVLSYAGLTYRFHDGVWYEPRGPAFMVVSPPIGLVVQTLPTFSTVWAHGGEVYLYCNDVYYQPRPDLGGYEIVNDPTSESTPKVRAAAAPSVAPGAAAPAAAPAVAPAAIPAVAPAVAQAVGPGIGAMAPKPTAAQIANGTAPAIEPDDTPPPVVTPYTVPSATAASASGAGSGTGGMSASASAPFRAAARMTPDPAPAVMAPTAAPPAVAASPALALAPAAAPAATAAMPNTAPPPTYTTPPAAAPLPAATPTPAVAIATSATAPVALPATYSSGSPAPQPKGVRADVVPRNNQSAEQLARDRYECYQFAVKQSGYDPIHSAGTVPQQQYDYDRAQSGCFDARGYSVR